MCVDCSSPNFSPLRQNPLALAGGKTTVSQNHRFNNPEKEKFLSPCNFATLSTACILLFRLPVSSRPMKWRSLSARISPRVHGELGWKNHVRNGDVLFKRRKPLVCQALGFFVISQPQSITQKGVHAHLLAAREREHWFL